MAQEDVFKKIVSHCKEYGFVFPSSDIYDGLAAVYDYGQNGVELKNNIKEYWWKSMVLLHENIVGIDSAIFMHPTIWKASGHVDAFNDPLIDNRDSKKRYRADVLIEDQIAKYEDKIAKEVEKARKKFGDAFDEAKFRETNPRVIGHQQKRDALHERYTKAMQGPDLAELKQIIVDEGTALRFCPAKPKMPSSASLTAETSPQDMFYALDMEAPFDPEKNSDNLISLPIQEEAGRNPKAFKGIASVYDMHTGMLSESIRAEGERVITFNGMLKYDMLPLAQIIDDMLKLGTEAMAEPVEIEFAINTEHGERPDFSILQIRPISGKDAYMDISITKADRENALVYAEKVMGNGCAEGISDIITIKPEVFKASEMTEMASELDKLNKAAEGEYVLIAAGRLGSSDRWLGIPCTWSQISKAHVIVETGLKEIQAEPSQGTHFFQNMTSLGCLYLTINPMYGDGLFDYEAIKKLQIIDETKHFLHVRAAQPLTIRADGLSGKAVIRTTEE